LRRVPGGPREAPPGYPEEDGMRYPKLSPIPQDPVKREDILRQEKPAEPVRREDVIPRGAGPEPAGREDVLREDRPPTPAGRQDVLHHPLVRRRRQDALRDD